MYLSEQIQAKWAPVLDHAELGKITDPYKRAVTAIVLENQERALREEAGVLSEAAGVSPANAAGNGGYGSGATAGGPVAGFDPILISLVRRSLPNLMAYDICGVQPMTGPTGLIFAMRSIYSNTTSSKYNTTYTPEALFNESNTAFSGLGTHSPFDTANVNPATGNTSYFNVGANTGYGANTAYSEAYGNGDNTLNQMGFSIEKVTVTANTRALQAAYTIELAQDLKAVHGLDAETELANILSTEILAEINREVVRSVYVTANVGAQFANVAGVYNLATVSGDTDARWQVEKFKGLIYQIERESNKIAKDTRRGKGNMIICSSDVASALAMSGLLDYQSALTNNTALDTDPTGNTFAGTLFGRIKVYVDPYSVSGADYCVVGYKGSTAYDAGLFYCPYVPLQMVRAIDPNTFQPKIGFKTRYGLVANPFSKNNSQSDGSMTANSNVYYRKFIVSNLK